MLRFVFLCLVLLLGPTAQAQLTSPFGGSRSECPIGTQQCGFRNCCRAGTTCSWDGHCIPLGGTYCGGGRSCPVGQFCIDGGLRCSAHGSKQCGNGKVCPPGTVCTASGDCRRTTDQEQLLVPGADPTTGCLLGGGCSNPGWFQCEETTSECRPGFKCSKGRGCVPVKAIDCGYGKWCKPGEQCLPEGGCEKLPDGD